MVGYVHRAARLLDARNGIRNAVNVVLVVCLFFQGVGRKERIGKLTEGCSFESCLETYGRKESEMREGSSRKVICMQKTERRRQN